MKNLFTFAGGIAVIAFIFFMIVQGSVFISGQIDGAPSAMSLFARVRAEGITQGEADTVSTLADADANLRESEAVRVDADGKASANKMLGIGIVLFALAFVLLAVKGGR